MYMAFRLVLANSEINNLSYKLIHKDAKIKNNLFVSNEYTQGRI